MSEIMLPSGKKFDSAWCGDVNGIPRKVNKIFRGNENNEPVLAWEDKAKPDKVYLTDSGIWTVPKGVYSIDIFLVGGGSSGSSGGVYRYYDSSGGVSSGMYFGGGGSGGYVKTVKGIAVKPGQNFLVKIGTGGTGSSNVGFKAGGSTVFGTYEAKGGFSDTSAYKIRGDVNGNNIYTDGACGGTRGGNGYYSVSVTVVGQNGYEDGKPYGTTTREFGETDGKLYAPGGGGGDYFSTKVGGAVGGGSGLCWSPRIEATSAEPNSGGGGGGSAEGHKSGSGGSGIVVVRWGY